MLQEPSLSVRLPCKHRHKQTKAQVQTAPNTVAQTDTATVKVTMTAKEVERVTVFSLAYLGVTPMLYAQGANVTSSLKNLW